MEEVRNGRETFIVQRWHGRADNASREAFEFIKGCMFGRMRGEPDFRCVSVDGRRKYDDHTEWYVETRFVRDDTVRPGGDHLCPPVPDGWALVYDSRCPEPAGFSLTRIELVVAGVLAAGALGILYAAARGFGWVP